VATISRSVSGAPLSVLLRRWHDLKKRKKKRPQQLRVQDPQKMLRAFRKEQRRAASHQRRWVWYALEVSFPSFYLHTHAHTHTHNTVCTLFIRNRWSWSGSIPSFSRSSMAKLYVTSGRPTPRCGVSTPRSSVCAHSTTPLTIMFAAPRGVYVPPPQDPILEPPPHVGVWKWLGMSYKQRRASIQLSCLSSEEESETETEPETESEEETEEETEHEEEEEEEEEEDNGNIGLLTVCIDRKSLFNCAFTFHPVRRLPAPPASSRISSSPPSSSPAGFRGASRAYDEASSLQSPASVCSWRTCESGTLLSVCCVCCSCFTYIQVK
jgi:hypothetical protein